MQQRDSKNWIWIVALIGGLALGAAGCDRVPLLATLFATPTATATPTTPPTPTHTPLPTPTPTKATVLPTDSQVLSEARGDLIGDGSEMRVVGFRTARGDGVAAGDWQMMLPEGEKLEGVQIRNLTDGPQPQLLVFSLDPDGFTHYLYIYGWEGDTLVAHEPHGGPLDSERAFHSLYYAPHIEDGDFNGTEEISIFRKAENPNYLEVFFYEWDWGDHLWRYATHFMTTPLHVVETPTPIR